MKDFLKIKTIAEVHGALGSVAPKHPLVTVIRHDDGCFNITEVEQSVVSDLYMIMFKDKLSGSFGYGRNSYDFEEGTVLFLAPGQVLTPTIDSEHSDTGWSILFHPDLIRKLPLGKTIEGYSFFSYEVHEALHLSQEEQRSLMEIVEKIEQEINQKIDKHSQKLIVSNIELLLDYCTRYFDRQFYTRSDLHQDVVSRFEHLLKGYFQGDKPRQLGIPTVKYCGQELNMSSNYLSDLLKKETGRNAREHIYFYLIEKAKTELLSSSEPVSQIAYNLGFEYPQHFSKIFKRKTGMSPTQWRVTDN